MENPISDKVCRMVCECSFKSDFNLMRRQYEIKIDEAKLKKHDRQVELLERDLSVILRLAREVEDKNNFMGEY